MYPRLSQRIVEAQSKIDNCEEDLDDLESDLKSLIEFEKQLQSITLLDSDVFHSQKIIRCWTQLMTLVHERIAKERVDISKSDATRKEKARLLSILKEQTESILAQNNHSTLLDKHLIHEHKRIFRLLKRRHIDEYDTESSVSEDDELCTDKQITHRSTTQTQLKTNKMNPYQAVAGIKYTNEQLHDGRITRLATPTSDIFATPTSSIIPYSTTVPSPTFALGTCSTNTSTTSDQEHTPSTTFQSTFKTPPAVETTTTIQKVHEMMFVEETPEEESPKPRQYTITTPPTVKTKREYVETLTTTVSTAPHDQQHEQKRPKRTLRIPTTSISLSSISKRVKSYSEKYIVPSCGQSVVGLPRKAIEWFSQHSLNPNVSMNQLCEGLNAKTLEAEGWQLIYNDITHTLTCSKCQQTLWRLNDQRTLEHSTSSTTLRRHSNTCRTHDE
jgi:hypothetical protein